MPPCNGWRRFEGPGRVQAQRHSGEIPGKRRRGQKRKKKILKNHMCFILKQNFRIEEEGRTEFGATDHAPPWSERGDENYGQNLF